MKGDFYLSPPFSHLSCLNSLKDLWNNIPHALVMLSFILSGFVVFFSQTIPGYFQVLSRSQWSFSRFLCGQFWQVDTKSILKLQKHKTWKILSKYNIEMLYILTFQVLSMFSAKFPGFPIFQVLHGTLLYTFCFLKCIFLLCWHW